MSTSRTRVAIVGITGDPPTLGHIWLAQTADKTGDFDMVWLMPCYHHKLKKLLPGQKPSELQPSTADHRFAMTVIAANESGGLVSPSAYEIERQSDGSCFYTTLSIRESYPSWDITWVIGLDNALHFDAWEHSAALKAGFVPFLVCSRPGVTIPAGSHWFHSSPHRFTEGNGGVECSSSKFRKLYREGDARCNEMVSPGVLGYIRQHGLYLEDRHEAEDDDRQVRYG